MESTTYRSRGQHASTVTPPMRLNEGCGKSAFLNKANIHMITLVYTIYNVQDYNVLYNNAVRVVTCKDWYFTRMLKHLL